MCSAGGTLSRIPTREAVGLDVPAYKYGPRPLGSPRKSAVVAHVIRVASTRYVKGYNVNLPRLTHVGISADAGRICRLELRTHRFAGGYARPDAHPLCYW
ncbi:MAG: hypothetical protein WAV47_15340 [Blastocatellia bacterium]